MSYLCCRKAADKYEKIFTIDQEELPGIFKG